MVATGVAEKDAIEKATRQPLTEMELPTAEDVNLQRVAKFHVAITAALHHRQLTGHPQRFGPARSPIRVPLRAHRPILPRSSHPSLRATVRSTPTPIAA